MPTWNQVLHELQSCNRVDALDFVRRKYLKKLHKKTNRNIIAYYSGWLQYPNINLGNAHICDDDKNGFMATIHGIDRSRGLDLILHYAYPVDTGSRIFSRPTGFLVTAIPSKV